MGYPQVYTQSVRTVKLLFTLMLHVRRRVFYALVTPLREALRSSVGKSARGLRGRRNR